MKIYNVFLHTVLGRKKGTLKIEIDNGRLTGKLFLLGHSEPLSGTIDEKGNCLLEGRFVTLLNTVDFKASGTIRCDSLNLTIKSKRSTFEMTGTLSGQEGREDNEEVLYRNSK